MRGTVLIITILSVALQASNTDRDSSTYRFNLGFAGGVNFASMYGAGIEDLEEEYDISARVSANTAFSLEFKPVPSLGIEVGVCFSGKGYKYDFYRTDDIGIRYDYEVVLKDGFVDFPLVAKPSLNVNNTRLYLVAGAAYGRVYKATRDISIRASFMGMDTTFDVPTLDYFNEGEGYPVDTAGTVKHVPYDDLYRLDDFSIVIGAGIESKPLPFGSPMSFFIDLRYFLGLRDHTRLTPEGRDRLRELAEEYIEYLEENNLDPADYGFGSDGSVSRAPIHKYSTFLISAGIRFHF